MKDEQTVLGCGITSDPERHDGEPILAGTATPVRAVIELWQQGVPIETIPVQLPHLELPRVLEAIYYYLGHREEINRHIAANHIPSEWSGRRFDATTGRIES